MPGKGFSQSSSHIQSTVKASCEAKRLTLHRPPVAAASITERQHKTNLHPPWQPFVVPAASGNLRNQKTFSSDVLTVLLLSMQGATALVVFLAHVWFCQTCSVIKEVLICRSIPSEFSPGHQILLMVLQNAGKINSTVFHRNGFGSITTLILDGSGITEISENAFGSAEQLRSLSLDRNDLSEINSNWFQDPALLNTLSLVGNQIEVVNATTLHGMKSLKQLWLDKNRIRTIHHDSFNTLVSLTEVGLSENWLTRLSPQLLRSLGSLSSIRLHGNPWGCMCDSEDFVATLRDLQNRSVLVQPVLVTCETPPSLKGQPIFNVTVCLMKTEPTIVFTSTESISSSPSASEPSFRTNPPITVSASSATGTPSPRMTRTSTSSMNTGSHALSSSSVYSKPTFSPFMVLKPTGATVSASSAPPAPDSNILWTLVSIVVLLSLLLGMVCFLVAMHRQKRSSKTVTPECPGEGDQEKQRGQEVSGSIIDLSSKSSELRGPEMASRRCFRAKSAHAVILTAPFGVSGRDGVTFQAETEESSDVSVNPQDRKQNPAPVTEVEQHHLTSLTIMEALKEHERGGEERRDLKENQKSLGVSKDGVPYLSIGRGQNEPGPDKESTEGPGQSPQRRKVMSRISTWPPTAAQWQARCKMKEEEEDEELDVWTGGAAEKTVNQTKPGGSDHHSREEEINQPESSTHQKELKEEEELQEDEELREEEELKDEDELSEKAAGGTGDGISQRHQQTSPEKTAHKSDNSSKAEAAPSKQSKAAGSKAPSGGATPDDETLLSGNEYVFMNLLHEVAHNNGRWTRERWKQTHLNKQRL